MDEPRTCTICGLTFRPRNLMLRFLRSQGKVRCPRCHGMVYAQAPSQSGPLEQKHPVSSNEEDLFRRRIEESRLEELR